MIEDLIAKALKQRRESCLEEARQNLLEAVSGAQSLLARSLTALGQIERDLGDRETALEHYQEAASMNRHENNRLRLAHTIRHVADIYLDTGSPELAEPFYREAADIYRNSDETKPLDSANTLRGFALLREDVEAKALWLEAQDLYTRSNVVEGAAEMCPAAPELSLGLCELKRARVHAVTQSGRFRTVVENVS